MKTKNAIKNNIIITLCLTIIILTIGFTLLVLKIESFNQSPTFNVEFTDLKSNIVVQGGLIEPDTNSVIDNKKKTLSLIFNLNSYQDEINYTVKVKNTGNLDAKIFIYEENEYYNNMKLPIKISHTNINNKVLKPNEEILLNINCIVEKEIGPNTVTVPYKLTIISESYND